MKRLFLIILLALAVLSASSQAWTSLLPQDKVQNSSLTFNDIQKAFYDYWKPFNVVRGRYMNSSGEVVKAVGWKQFKRWEWYWENRVDPATGKFPETSAFEELQKFKQDNPEVPNSFSGNWTSVGPSTSSGGYAGLGRINCVAFDPSNSSVVYAGAASGGLWITTNGGSTWTVSGDNNPVLGVSDICVVHGTLNTIYIATGDRELTMGSLGGQQNHDNNSVGVLKSTDGGATWNTTGLSFVPSQQRAINRLLMDPSDNNILYAATTAGVYKTINAGSNWTLIYGTEFSDMEFKPDDPATIYGSSKAGDIYRTIDGGSNWTTRLSTTFGRVEMAVTPADVNIVYAVMQDLPTPNDESPVYKSTDGGSTFVRVFTSTTKSILGYDCDGSDVGSSQASYDLCIASDPNNANIVFVGGVNTWKSSDGGSTWDINSHWSGNCSGTATTIHADKHYLAFQPVTNYLFEGNDGGLYKTTNSGATWTYIGSGMVTSQAYRIGISQSVPDEYITGLQDNGTKAYLSGVWDDVIGGDGMECAVDYADPNVLYGEYVNGDISRSVDHGVNWTPISSGLTGTGTWITPYAIDPNVNTTLYIGYQDVFKSTDRGTTWNKISPWNASGLRSLTVAPSNSGYIYTATTSILYRTTNGGTSWSNITGTLPVGSNKITYISVKADDPNTVWVSMGNYNANKVYQTTDGGTTWTDISAGLPSIPVMCVIQNKQAMPRIDLYAATDVGVYMKSGSSNWQPFSTNLPNALATELEIYYAPNADNNRLYTGTYGRGIWSSDLYTVGLPSVANFTADNLTPPTATAVNFTDLSSYTPTAWAWTFNPSTVTFTGGTSSTSQNPKVMFNSPGSYTVTLVATNANGNGSKTRTAYIHAGQYGIWTGNTSSDWDTPGNWENELLPGATNNITINPSANPPVRTGNLTLGADYGNVSLANGTQLTLTGDLTIGSGTTLSTSGTTAITVGGSWLNNGSFDKGTGTTEFTGNADATVARSVFVFGGGKATVGTSLTSANNHFLQFDCTTAFTIKTAKVQAGTAGNRTFYWANSAGVVQQTVTINVPAGTSRVTLNFNIPVGTNHQLGVSALSSYLYADNTGLTYPYAIGSVGSIKNADGTLLNRYYYYYDLEYSTPGPENFNNLVISKTGASVLFPGGANVAGNCNLKPGAWLTNNTGGALTISGNFSLESDATATGSFIDLGTTTVTGTTSVERYMTGNWSGNWPPTTITWHYVSSPVSGATINVFTGALLNSWDEPGNTWTPLTIPLTTPLVVNKGYCAATTSAGLITYTGGSLNTGNQAVSGLSNTDGSASRGFNLVGNAFPSAIKWNGSVTRTNVDAAAYLWTGSTYAAYLTGDVPAKAIPSEQGFFVHVTTGQSSGSMSVPNSNRVHADTVYAKSGAGEQLILKVNGNNLEDATSIRFNSNSTEGFDGEYDAYKLWGIDACPQIYSINPDDNLSINSLPEFTSQTVVPVGFRAGVTGPNTITASGLESFPYGTEFYLEDLLINKTQNLVVNPTYEFTASPGGEAHRFNLHFSHPSGIDDDTAMKMKVYSAGNMIYVKIPTEMQGDIRVYDLLGNVVAHQSIMGNAINRLTMEGYTGYYLVKVLGDKATASGKVFIW